VPDPETLRSPLLIRETMKCRLLVAGHYVQNTGDEDLVFLELFVAPQFQDISLNKWLRALPQQAAVAHTNLKKEDLERIPADGNPVIR
jgi:oxalate decarboxylase